jgi:thiazole/oxazole-forming peptide maturase SagD family component
MSYTFDNSIQPLMTFYSYTNENGELIINLRKKQQVISSYVEEIQAILTNSNGYNTINDICVKVNMVEKEIVVQLCQYLLQEKILCDSRNLFAFFHQDTSNPPLFYHSHSYEDVAKHTTRFSTPKPKYAEKIPESQFLNLLNQRSTTRDFSDELLSNEHINLLISVLNKVPHAGGIDGLTTFLAIHKSSGMLQKRVYKITKCSQLEFIKEIDIDLLTTILDGGQVIPDSGITVFITADFTKQGFKYGNRAYRYAHIECGHIAQNIQLLCAEQNLAVLEYGGFLDKPCADFLGLNYPNKSVLLVLFVGQKSNVGAKDIELQKTQQIVSSLKQEYVGKGKIIKWFNTTMLQRDNRYFPRIVFDGTYSIPEDDECEDYRHGRAFATAQCHNLAFIKGCAEAIERYSSGLVKYGVFDRAVNLQKRWIHPYTVTPWHERMFLEDGFIRFTDTLPIEWVQGHNVKNNEPVFAVVENVFYPLYKSHKIKRKLVTECSSNGVSAHPDLNEAIHRALLELIERDALMVTWFARRPVVQLSDNLLSSEIQIRKEYWHSQGYQMTFLDISIDTLPVVLCLLWSQNHVPALLAGASCHENLVAAITKSCDEAEFQLMSWDHNSTPIMAHEDVRTPAHHALLYSKPDMLQHVDWLLNTPILDDPIIKHGTLDKLNPIVFILKEPKFEGDFWVVRVIEESLMPIHFGYQYEHYMHSRIKNLGLVWKHEYPSIPHFFA